MTASPTASRDSLAESDVFVSHEWLAEHHDDVTIVDVRSPDEYDTGHLPRAVNIPFREFRDDGETDVGKLPGADRFSALLGEWGISPTNTLVAIDDTYGVYAARFLVTALIYGHDAVRLPDGDYTAWTRAFPVTDSVPNTPSTAYPSRRAEETPLLRIDGFAAAVDSDVVIVDTRVKYEYRVAHVPGAISLNWRRFVDNETRRLKPRDEIERVLTDRGITPDRKVVLYCNTARRLSFTYAVLKHVGYKDVTFYEGGLPAWVDHGGSIETAD